MHEKRSKIDFFVNFRKLQKKLPICKKKFTKILNSVRAVVTDIEKKVKRRSRNFFGMDLGGRSVLQVPHIKTTAGKFFRRIRPIPLTWKCININYEPSEELREWQKRENDYVHMWHIPKNRKILKNHENRFLAVGAPYCYILRLIQILQNVPKLRFSDSARKKEPVSCP